MPTYRYECDACGSFDAVRPLSAFADPCACPDCGAASARQLAGPMLRNAAAPAQAGPAAPKAAHRAGCGCCTPAMKPGTAAAAKALGAPKTARAPAPSSFLSRG